MNFAKTLLKNLIKRYGLNKGVEVYIKMAKEKKGPFGSGKKYGDK